MRPSAIRSLDGLGLALARRLLAEHPHLGLPRVVRHVLLGDVHRAGGGHVRRDLARELGELVVAGHEVRLAVHLHERADLAVVVHVAGHQTLAGRRARRAWRPWPGPSRAAARWPSPCRRRPPGAPPCNPSSPRRCARAAPSRPSPRSRRSWSAFLVRVEGALLGARRGGLGGTLAAAGGASPASSASRRGLLLGLAACLLLGLAASPAPRPRGGPAPRPRGAPPPPRRGSAGAARRPRRRSPRRSACRSGSRRRCPGIT